VLEYAHIESHGTFSGEPSRPFREVSYGILIAFIYVISRLVFTLKGGSFIATPLAFAYQYLDPVLLKGDLLRSLLYLHAQPPQ